MSGTRPLPCSDHFDNAEHYVESLLALVHSDGLLRTLCGGVHILDFFTSEPPLYTQVLPQEWRDFFAEHEVMDILDLLLREDLSCISKESRTWHGARPPPESLITYIDIIRKHALQREPTSSQCTRNRVLQPALKLARHVAVGMTMKKIHEVGLFASYINNLCTTIQTSFGLRLTHLVDFGSGQNYLGRALASEPYHRNIVAVESKQANAQRAREFDVMAKLATKEKIMRNKKAFRAQLGAKDPKREDDLISNKIQKSSTEAIESHVRRDDHKSFPAKMQQSEPESSGGKILYVDHHIEDGDLADVIAQIPKSHHTRLELMVMSLHSCGNLVHHGLRSIVLNPDVKAVALIGCCYNLVTERLGPASYKLPELRPTTHSHPRLGKSGEPCDPHGFPMSTRFCEYRGPVKGRDSANSTTSNEAKPEGIRLNITARMMAVQAPSNWGTSDSESFFTRHYYRALLQRVFLDRGVVGPPSLECVGGRSPAGHTSNGGTPIVIGSLRKSCYKNFASYARGAIEKLEADPDRGNMFREKMSRITEEDLEEYEKDYASGRKNLSVIWSLMAFSAGVIEAAIVVDRWLWMKEQTVIGEAWVEPVFDPRFSPRNMVVVGLKSPRSAASDAETSRP